MPPDIEEIEHITENMVAMNSATLHSIITVTHNYNMHRVYFVTSSCRHLPTEDLLKPLVHAYGQAEVVATVPVLTPMMAQLFTAAAVANQSSRVFLLCFLFWGL